MDVLGAVGLIVGVIVYSVLTRAFVLSVLWGWFVAPIFGVGTPPLPLLAGLSALVGYLTQSTETTAKDPDASKSTAIVKILTAPWVALGFAWLIHLWAGNL
jgi:hypothetical protein